jgi:hypothetical protein
MITVYQRVTSCIPMTPGPPGPPGRPGLNSELEGSIGLVEDLFDALVDTERTPGTPCVGDIPQ